MPCCRAVDDFEAFCVKAWSSGLQRNPDDSEWSSRVLVTFISLYQHQVTALARYHCFRSLCKSFYCPDGLAPIPSLHVTMYEAFVAYTSFDVAQDLPGGFV